MAIHLKGDEPPFRSDTRIDDEDMDRFFRKEPVGSLDHGCSSQDVLGRDAVGDVHHEGMTADREHNPLHHPDILIFEAEIRKQRDDRRTSIHRMREGYEPEVPKAARR